MCQTDNENEQGNKRGPRPFLTEARQKEVCSILALGGTRAMAARYVGCNRATIRRTELSDQSFAEELRKSEFGAETLLLKSIQGASQQVSQWRAAAWVLERLYPERYGRRAPHTITRDQLSELLRQLGLELAHDIPADDIRQQLLARLQELARPATSSAAKPLFKAAHRFAAEKT